MRPAPGLVVTSELRLANYETATGGTVTDASWSSGLTTTLDKLEHDGLAVVALHGVPVEHLDPGSCLSAYPSDVPRCSTTPKASDPGRYDAATRAGTLAAHAGSVDLAPLFCTSTTCPDVADAQLTHAGDNHVDEAYASPLAAALGELLGCVTTQRLTNRGAAAKVLAALDGASPSAAFRKACAEPQDLTAPGMAAWRGGRPRSAPAPRRGGGRASSWYRESVPAMSITVRERWYGYLSDADGSAYPRVLVTLDDPARVADALDEAAAELDVAGFGVWVDDRGRAARLEDALRASRCRPKRSTTYLALVGAITADPGPPDLAVEVVADAAGDLARWAATKVRGFAETDDEPAPEAVGRELGVRRREWLGIELWLATLAGEPAAVLARYVGDDEFVFNLATRAPYRRRGIAQSLLARWAAHSAGAAPS